MALQKSMPLYAGVGKPSGDDDPVKEVAPSMVNFVIPNLHDCKYFFRMK